MTRPDAMRLSSPKPSRSAEWPLTLPSLGWLVVFLAIPSLIILAVSFRAADYTGGIGGTWTLANWSAWADPGIRVLLWRTLWIAAATTILCLPPGMAMAWFMASRSGFWRNLLLLLVVVPFWTNLLIRIFSWKTLLADGGMIAGLFRAIHLMDDNDSLLHNSGCVLLVMVYTHLPFAILPLYAAAEKFDRALLDAARDLGATATRAFFAVFVPGIRVGIGAAGLMVFVPALGAYLIPDIVGGHDADMIGNRIAQRATSDRNLPEAAALASGLAGAVILTAMLAWRWKQSMGSKGGLP